MKGIRPRSIDHLRWQARAQLELRAREMANLGVQDFIPRLSKGFDPPRHLLRFTQLWEQAVEHARRPDRGKPVRAVCSVPPRHQKTETLLHAMAWGLRRRPELTFGFISYGASLAESKSARAKLMAQGASVAMSESMQKRQEWRTRKGGGLLATGIGGALTGQGLDIVAIDDPFKNRVEAESAAKRDSVYDYHHDVALSRLEPGGSVFVLHARWHPDDLIGRLVKDGYELINFPAIADEDDPITGRKAGEALLPHRYPADCELFKEQQRVPYTWESLYQGRPRPRGAKVFVDVHVYDPAKLPESFQIGIGIDFAYSEKTYSDWSVAVVVAKAEGRYYILDVKREQVKSEVFEETLHKLQRSYPLARMLFRGSSIECVIGERMRRDGLKRLENEQVHGDKLVRAEPAAKAWNGGLIMVPHDEADELPDGTEVAAYTKRHTWVPTFTEEVNAFTGVKDPNDDCVDALANAIACVDRANMFMGRIDAARLLEMGKVRDRG